MSSGLKVNLDVLNRLVQEINVAHKSAASLHGNKASVAEFVVDVSKLMGLLSGLTSEATYLVMDAAADLKNASMGGAKALSDMDLPPLTEVLGKTPKKTDSNN